jgi:hypothetical protein
MMKKIDRSDSKMDEKKPSEERDEATASPRRDGSASGTLPDYKKEQEGLSYPLFRFFDQSGKKHLVLSSEIPARGRAKVVTYHLFLKDRWSDGSEITEADISFITRSLEERAKATGFVGFVDIHR